ncbi:MAG: protein phosphatase 2C domain-containing protein, partial [Chloroflexota bacterium]
MIPAERAHLYAAADTHPGMTGKNNEDRYSVSAFRIEGEKPRPALLALVCDGIGGHRAGEVAAEIAIDTIVRTAAQDSAAQPLELLRQAIQQASQNIYAHAQSDPNRHGMGSTCAAALIIENRLFVAYVGDSRIYLLRGGQIFQLSIDHTWIQEALDAGVITQEQVFGHPNAHVIRRYLGSAAPVEVDTRLRLSPQDSDEQMFANQGTALLPADQLLLCSDGLTDLVRPEEILAALQAHPANSQPEALRQLIALANERGGHDNITIVALQAPANLSDQAPTIPAPVSAGQITQAAGASSSTAPTIPVSIAGGAAVSPPPGAAANTGRAPAAAPPARWKTLAGCLLAVLLAGLVIGALGAAY